MNKEFRATLPQKFVENTISLCGEKGERWLNDLPGIIASLESAWSVKISSHFRNLSYNFVASALRPDGTEAVLKIGLPLDDVEIFGEAAYLASLNGRGAAELFEFDRELQAILIERVKPGASLRIFCRKDQQRAVDIAIKTIKRILQPSPYENKDFILLDDWFDGLKRAIGTKFPQDYAEKALALYAELSMDNENTYLLHGDIHHDNILAASREPFLVIDPKGMIGHVGYDIGVFLNNHKDWLEWNTRLDAKLALAVAEFAAAFELEAPVVRKWAFCQMVLSWWWMFDEMPEMFDELGLSDIWKV